LSSRSFALLLMSTKTSSLFLGVALLCVVVLIFLYTYSIGSSPLPNLENGGVATLRNSINVYIFPLPESFNYGLLKSYWSLKSDSRIGSEVDNEARKRLSPRDFERPLPYPENPVIKQYSAEYWLMGDLLAHEELRVESFAKRVFDSREADVIFVPFFATLSAELQLVTNKAVFRKKAAENEDYMRQKKMIDLVKNSEAWQRSGGRDHVYVLT
ncbi:exostosin family protein, partial [Genlisea aurea]